MKISGRTKILIVDDRRENLVAIETLLQGLELEIHAALSGSEALTLMLHHDYAVVLMDVQMPEMDGFEAVELMKQSRRTRDVPVLYLTAQSTDSKHVIKGYEVGAVDYIFKPVEPVILRGKVKVFLALDRMRKELSDQNEQLKAARRELQEAAMRDPLTGLHNRRFLQTHINTDAALARRASWGLAHCRPPDPHNRDLGFLMIDVDTSSESMTNMATTPATRCCRSLPGGWAMLCATATR